MPFLDRYWWLRMLPSMLLAAYATVFGIYALNFLSRDWDTPIQLDAGAIGLIAFFGLTVIAVLVVQAHRALAARRRHRLRLAALRGERDAVPPSSVAPDPDKAPDLADGPLVLLWRPLRQRERRPQSQLDPRIRRAVNIFQVLFFGGSLAYILGQSIFDDLQRGEPVDQAILHEAWLFGPLIAGALVLFLLVTLGWRAFVGIRGAQPYGVVATAEGIVECTPLGRRRMGRWAEARLLEVFVGRRFRLLGTHSFVQWSQAVTAGIGRVPDGITGEEMTERQRALLDLVAARTGLTPRTFERPLQPGGEVAMQRRARGEGRVTVLVFAAWLVTLAAGVLIAPLGSQPEYNYAVAGLLAMATLLLPYSVEWGTGRAHQVAPSYSLAPALDALSADTFLLTLTAPRRLTLLRSAIALLLLGAGVVGYIAFQIETSASSTYLLEGSVSSVVWSVLLIFGLFFTGFMAGLALLLFLFWLCYTTSVRADTAGLRVNTVSGSSTIAWSDIKRVIVGVRGGRTRFYRVLGAEGKVLADWGPHFSRKPAREARSVSVTSDQMAALVAQRTGITPEIVDADQPLLEPGGQE